jgi:hypothetical protein
MWLRPLLHAQAIIINNNDNNNISDSNATKESKQSIHETNRDAILTTGCASRETVDTGLCCCQTQQ